MEGEPVKPFKNASQYMYPTISHKLYQHKELLSPQTRKYMIEITGIQYGRIV